MKSNLFERQLRSECFAVAKIKDTVIEKEVRRSTNTFKYYYIFIIFEPATFSFEQKDFAVSEPSIVFVSPSKTVEWTSLQNEDNSYVIAFSSSLYERSAQDSVFLNSELFYNISGDITVTPTEIMELDFERFAIHRLSLYLSEEKELYSSIIHNTIETLILDGMRHISHISLNNTLEHSASMDIVNSFRILLHRDFKKNKTTGYYADLLNMTSRRLTQITEKVVGKTPKQLITEKLIKEGVRLLKYSNLSVAEISDDLVFSDDANFSSFIKKHTGKTPSDIRNEINDVLMVGA